MEGPRRISGFMDIARETIHKKPGLTAKDVYLLAERSSEETGRPISAAANPEASLVATLHKYHREHGLERRVGKGGVYRYYPKGQAPIEPWEDTSKGSEVTIPPKTQEHHQQSVAGCCIELPSQDFERIKALVVLGKYANEHEAHSDLVKKGLDVILNEISG